MRTRISKGTIVALVATATTTGIYTQNVQNLTKVVAIVKGGAQPDPEPTRPGGGMPLPDVQKPSVRKYAAIRGIYCKGKQDLRTIVNAYNAA